MELCQWSDDDDIIEKSIVALYRKILLIFFSIKEFQNNINHSIEEAMTEYLTHFKIIGTYLNMIKFTCISRKNRKWSQIGRFISEHHLKYYIMDFAKFIHQKNSWNIVLEIFFVGIDIVKITFSDKIWSRILVKSKRYLKR